MSIKKFLVLLAIFFIATNVHSIKILATDIDAKVKKEYKGLRSFSINVTLNIIDKKYKYILSQDEKDVYIQWEGLDNGTYIREEDIPVIPLSVHLFTDPYSSWLKLGIDTTHISYEYVNHMPCLVLGDNNKIYIDIEHFSIRKIVINNISYLFSDFMYIGNYYLPQKIDIMCSDSIIKGDIEWTGINQVVENRANNIRGSYAIEPLINCLPNFSQLFR